MRYDQEKVREYIKQAPTEDLLHRITVYRRDMEPEALELMENELTRRNVNRVDIQTYEDELNQKVIFGPNGQALRCAYCERPATTNDWGWFRLWGKIPVFPRPLPRCDLHKQQVTPAS